MPVPTETAPMNNNYNNLYLDKDNPSFMPQSAAMHYQGEQQPMQNYHLPHPQMQQYKMPQRVNINSPNLHPKYRNKSQMRTVRSGVHGYNSQTYNNNYQQRFNNNYPPKRNRGGPVMRFGLKF